MLHTHHLNTATYSDFLNQKRVDPITGEKIEEGHTIVICAACKSAFFIESWEYLGNTHCSQDETLSQIPIARTLQLEAKSLEYLPFLFQKGKYFLDRGEDGSAKFAMKSLGFVLGMILYFTVLITITFFIGQFTIPHIALLFFIFVIGITVELVKPYYKGRRNFSRITANQATHLAINMKKQAIEYKRKNKKQTISFDKIKHIKYYFDYIPYTECGQYLQNVVSLEIATKDNKKIKHYTFLHKNEIPNWSKFLEELPYNLTVLNQK